MGELRDRICDFLNIYRTNMTDEDTVDDHDENCECEECSVERAIAHEEARADTYD